MSVVEGYVFADVFDIILMQGVGAAKGVEDWTESYAIQVWQHRKMPKKWSGLFTHYVIPIQCISVHQEPRESWEFVSYKKYKAAHHANSIQ